MSQPDLNKSTSARRRLFVLPTTSDEQNRILTALSRPAALLALLLACIASMIYNVSRQEQDGFAGIWMLMALVTVGCAIFLRRSEPYPEQITTYAAHQARRRTLWVQTLLGLLFLFFLAEISGDFFDPSFLSNVTVHPQFALFVFGPCLLAWGIAGKRIPLPELGPDDTQPTPVLDADSRITRREIILIVALTLIAFAVRFYDLDAVPYFVDEVHFINPITHFDVANDIELLLPFSNVAAFPYVYPYMEYLAVEVLGRNFEGLRAVSVLFGTVSILALYLLTRELFGKTTALVAVVLLLSFPPHMQFSRFALNNIADLVPGTLALYFVARGLQPGRSTRANFAWAGAMLGYTQYFYEGGRLLFPALVTIWLSVLLILVRFYGPALPAAETLRSSNFRWSLFALVFVALMVAAPVYYTLEGQHENIAIRMETAGLKEKTLNDISTPQKFIMHFAQRFYEAYLIHTTIPEASLYFAGQQPLLLAFISPFFFLGIGYVIWRFFSPAVITGGMLILLWVLLTWMGNTLMQESRLSPRYVVSFPALAIFIALGVKFVVDYLLDNSRRLRNLVLFGLVMLLASIQILWYFERHIPVFNEQFLESLGRDSHDALLRSQSLPPGTRAFIIDGIPIPNRDATQIGSFLNPDIVITTHLPPQIDAQFIDILLFDHYSYAFFVRAGDIRTINILKDAFPQMTGPYYSPRKDLEVSQQYVMYFTPADESYITIPDASVAE